MVLCLTTVLEMLHFGVCLVELGIVSGVSLSEAVVLLLLLTIFVVVLRPVVEIIFVIIRVFFVEHVVDL